MREVAAAAGLLLDGKVDAVNEGLAEDKEGSENAAPVVGTHKERVHEGMQHQALDAFGSGRGDRRDVK